MKQDYLNKQYICTQDACRYDGRKDGEFRGILDKIEVIGDVLIGDDCFGSPNTDSVG